MKKRIKYTTSLLLLVCILASGVFPVFAENMAQVPVTELSISSVEEFLSFAESCRLDTYSQNMVVSLNADLDLTDVSFAGIPIFSGTFEGNDHAIKGISITNNGSVQGLFRYLTATAIVKNLTVQGSILPEGSKKSIGGFAGSNAGTIENCHFQGEVSGNDYIGGLVGSNQVSGTIENCCVSGNVHGNHFIGGIAGENYGLIRNCKNDSGINITANENSVDISDISTDTIMGTESANTVTDIGGIAGSSSGVIRGCENHGTVGYQHMGYNIGGIAGSQNGFITECKNYGKIYGRKEIAGIVGQVEPVSKIEYTADTLQILQKQLASTSALANQASSNAHKNAQNLNSQMALLHDQADVALDAVKQLLPSEEEPHFPDEDRILAAKNALTSSMSSMQSTMDSITSSTRGGFTTASNDIRAITNQINAMSQTLNNASENIGGTITDISDTDTDNDLTGKISLCKNYGPVSGDLNVGGIAGAVAWENDLDPEDDLHISGDRSLHFDSELRAVILNSENSGVVSAKKRNVGGIVGRMSIGLAKACINTGFIDAESAEYVGGIAGNSSGFIRSCSAKCELDGQTYVGGIAGSTSVATDCRSMVRIKNASEKFGSVLGISSDESASVENPISGNYYLPLEENVGGIDGINYSGVAESLTLENFLNLNDLPSVFSNATVTFLFEDGAIQEIVVPLGEVLNKADIPVVPKKDGYIGKWGELEDKDLQNICFDIVLEPKYVSCRTVIQSEVKRENGHPIMLAEGQFYDLNHLELKPLEELPIVFDKTTAIEAWYIPDFPKEDQTQLRLALPEDVSSDSVKIMVKNINGNWAELPFTVNGSYLVFSITPTDEAICLAKDSGIDHLEIYIIGSVLILIILVEIVRFIKKKRR